MSAAVAVLGVMAVGAASIAWRGYALSVLWGWFVVGQFGLPALNVPQAVGIALVAAALTHRFIKAEAKSFEPLVDALLSPALMLAVGWVVKGSL